MVHDESTDADVVHVMTRYRRGGSEQRLRDFVRAVPSLRHTVIVGRDSSVDAARCEVGAPVIVEDALVRELDPRRDVRAVVHVARELRRLRPRLVVTHQSKAGLVGRLAALLAGRLPTMHSLSMADFGAGYGRGASVVHRAAERLLAPVTTRYAVVGTDLAARFEAAGVPGWKLRVVRSCAVSGPNGAAAPSRPPALPADRPVIVYAGSLEPRKHVLDLPNLLAGAIVGSPERRPFLAVAGDGPLAGDLARAFDDAGLSGDVALLGFVRPIEPLLRAADVAVLLSSAEGLPQVLVQAAAVGTPFVAYDVDGPAELLELGATGAVVPLHAVDAAAVAVAAFVRRAAEIRPETVDLSTWDAGLVDESYRRLVEEVLAAPPSVRRLAPLRDARHGRPTDAGRQAIAPRKIG